VSDEATRGAGRQGVPEAQPNTSGGPAAAAGPVPSSIPVDAQSDDGHGQRTNQSLWRPSHGGFPVVSAPVGAPTELPFVPDDATERDPRSGELMDADLGEVGPAGPRTGQSAPPSAAEPMPPSAAVSVEHALRGMFGRDSVYLVIWLLQLVAAAAATPFVTRLLGPRDFGDVASATAIMQVLFVLNGCGLQVAVQRWFAGPDGQRAAARMLTLSMLVAALVTAVAMLTGDVWSGLLGFRRFGATLQLAVLWAGACAVTTSGVALLRCEDKLLGYALASLMQSVVSQVLSLGFLVWVSNTSVAFLQGQALAQLLAVGVALAFAPPRLLRLRDGALIREGLRFGLPLVPAALGYFVLNVADRLMIHDELGRAAVARYQVAYNIGDLPMIALGALTMIWLPRLFAAAEDERKAILVGSQAALNRLLAPVMVGMSVASPIVLQLWAPPEFHPLDLMGLTAIIVLSAMPYTAVQSATRDQVSRGAVKPVAWSTLGAAVVNIGLNLVLIPALGIMGAAVATLLAFAAQYGLLLITTGWKWSHRHEWAAPLRLGVASILTLAVVFLPTDDVWLLLRFLVALGCLGWLGWSLRAITRERSTPGIGPPAHGRIQWLWRQAGLGGESRMAVRWIRGRSRE
jgi:O-antigen/teichoic acid export membrane protein